MTRHTTNGITLIEAVIVLAVLALLLSAVVMMLGVGGSVGRAARDVATAVRSARWAAVSEGRPVVLLGASDGGLARAAGTGFTCDVEHLTRLVWDRPPRVSVSWPRLGIAFAPDGRPRRCDGSGVGNTTVEVHDRHGDKAAVIVAITGRVRWEHR